MVQRSTQLTIDSFSIAIGEESVGLPASRSLDTLLSRYLELVSLMRHSDQADIRTDDVGVLAQAVGLSPEMVANRLRCLIVT